MNDLQIAHSVEPKDIKEIAAKLAIDEDDLILHGKHMAKLPLSLTDHTQVTKSNMINNIRDTLGTYSPATFFMADLRVKPCLLAHG